MNGKAITRVLLAVVTVWLLIGRGVYGRSWRGAGIIDTGSGNDAYEPGIALDGSGRALAVFVQDDGTNWRVYANSWVGVSWSGPVIIDSGQDNDASWPRVALGASGTAMAVFQEFDGYYYRVYANRWDGGTWSGATAIDAGPGDSALHPGVAMDGSGNAVAVFEQSDSGIWRICANFWNGSAWSGAEIIDAGLGFNAFIPAVAIDVSGKAVAVFRENDGINWRIYANIRNGTGWNAATAIDAGPGNNANNPRVAMDGSGNAVAVFDQDSDGVRRVYANFWDGATWSGATTIDAGRGEQANFPAVAMDESGEATAVFQQEDGGDDRVFANRWEGPGWSGVTAIDAGPGFDAYLPQAAMDGSGNAVAVFRQSDGQYYRIYANRRTGGSWSGTTTIDAGPGYNADDPQVAVDARESAFSVFRQSDGSNWRVYANRFPPLPAPWIYDYNGDGTSDIAIFRPASGLWAVRGITRVYFGGWDDTPVPADYSGDGTTDIGIFRPASGLWAARGVTRIYFGGATDIPVPGDYGGTGTAAAGVFRGGSGLWAIRGLTRAYFGSSADLAVPGYYAAAAAELAIFRPASGLWAVRGLTRVYFGSSDDTPVPGDYGGEGNWNPAIFRPASGLWAVRGVTRIYFGGTADRALPGGYGGDGTDRVGIFRTASGLWALRGLTRVYFGGFGDLPLTR